MTPDEFIAFVRDYRDMSINEKDTYEYCEKIHVGRHGFRKYASYEIFVSVRSRRLRKKIAELSKL